MRLSRLLKILSTDVCIYTHKNTHKNVHKHAYKNIRKHACKNVIKYEQCRKKYNIHI